MMIGLLLIYFLPLPLRIIKMMLSLIDYYQFLLEETDKHFSFEELNKYVSSWKLEYVHKTLPFINAGSSRSVYALSETEVLKMAMGEKGTTQNATEYKLFHSASPEVKEVLAKVLEPHDEEFQWIVMEKVKTFASEEEFHKYLGLSQEDASFLFSSFCFQHDTIEKIKAQIHHTLDQMLEFQKSQEQKYNASTAKYKAKLFPDPHIAKFQRLLKFTDSFAKMCLAVPHLESNGGDLGRLDQLGVASDGRVVIIDYGFGHETHSLFNPSIYQQVDAQQRSYWDVGGDYEDDGDTEYDKYGNKINKPKPVKTTSTPNQSTPSPFGPDDIPF